MAHSGDQPIDDQRLVQYLLGALPEQEAERLDELSIVDDDIAGRLRALENDLVDAFVRDELPESVREQVRAAYVASPARRPKVEFADLLFAFERSRGRATSARPSRNTFFQWAPLAASLVAAVVAGSLFVQNQRLRQAVGRSDVDRAALEQATNSLRSELERERATSARARDELAQRDAGATSQTTIASIVLLPMRRGVEQPTTVRLPRTSVPVAFRLRLDPDDFASYEATLRDSSDGRVVWRSPRLPASVNGTDRFLALQVPANLLAPNPYTFELTGRSAEGAAAFVTSYAFRVVTE